MIPRELALDLMMRGGKVLPLRADRSPVTHLVPDGFKNATDDTRDLWWFEHNDTEMVGLVPGSMGLLVLDVDVKRGVGGPAHLEALATIEGAAGWTTDDQLSMVRTPSGGFHLYLDKPEINEHIGNHDLVKGVNVRCNAGYVAAPGNAGYHFERGGFGGTTMAPAWVMKRLREAAQADAEAARADPYDIPEARMEMNFHPRVNEALRSFDPSGDRHTSMMLAVAALCSHELLGYAGATRALLILEETFVRAVRDRANEATARREYRRALDGARTRVRANTSIGIEERDSDRRFIEQIIRDAGGNADDVERVMAIEQHPTELQLWTMRDLMASDLTLNWLVRNVLVTPTYGQVAGEKKTLKTYLTQYLALAVASGQPFLGQFPIEKQGNVVMFVGEGGRIPWTRRMPRIAKSVGIDDLRGVPIYSVFQTAPLLSPAFKATIEKAISRLNPVLTIIDPLYAYHGSETNSANIHEEGALLTAVAAPFVDAGSNLLIVNHFKKGSESRGLNRITMAGSGEWVDSWMFTEEREPANLNTGDFYINVEFGSRQWGGSRWEIDFNVGVQNPMGEESDSPIQFEIRRSYA